MKLVAILVLAISALGINAKNDNYGPVYAPPPPAYNPPAYNPPAYNPQPPAYQPPAYQPPAYQPPAYKPPPPAPTPEPTTEAPTPEPTAPPATPPPPFVAPAEPYTTEVNKQKCDNNRKPNSARFMAYVCSSLYASAIRWGNNNCQGYYAVADPSNPNSLYQARLCTYWTQRSILNVVTSCYIEAHLRNEFVMKYGAEGPGIWWCRYQEFVNQVKDCYASSLKYYPLGESMNSIESSIAALSTTNDADMPPFAYTGVSVAMCAYYNKDQVYNPATYVKN